MSVKPEQLLSGAKILYQLFGCRTLRKYLIIRYRQVNRFKTVFHVSIFRKVFQETDTLIDLEENSLCE